MGDSNHRSSKGSERTSHRHRRKEEDDEEQDNGGERVSGREKHRDSSSKRREKEEKKKEKDRGRDRGRDTVREKVRDKDQVREKDRGKDNEAIVETDREREKEKRREKEREREKKKEIEREEKERERKKREREREREERERELERERKKREREKEERERQKEKEREREKRARDEEKERDRDREAKRRRRDDDKERERSSRSKRHRDDSEEDNKKKEEISIEKKEEKTPVDDLKKEKEDIEKRQKRVQEWQQKRKKEELEREKVGVAEVVESRKIWDLDGESDDEEAEKIDTDTKIEEEIKPRVENGMVIDSEKEKDEILVQNGGKKDGKTEEEEEIDPLDAFMNSVVLPEVEKLTNNASPAASNEMEIDSKREKISNGKNGEKVKKGSGNNKSMGRIIPGEDSDSDYEEDDEEENPEEEEDDEEFMKRVKKTKVDKLVIVDHSKIDYPPFRKNFYIEVREISRMSAEEVSNYRKQLELKLHGRDVPKPIHTWHQIGLSTKILDTIKKLGFEKPMPIQAQALPIIMSGRDCIGVAKTGSGKTLAFVLPMLRHIKDQPPLMSGDGPIGLIMAPTRELVQQIHSDIKKFIKPLGLTCVPVYGGSGVAQQIGELKRGAEIVVCTPGRMIDILCTSAGKITNLRRVTYLVMDEADRMFDMGFEPQITRIVQNIRPDRQTVLFSATFPKQVETLARKVLNKNGVEILMGGRSVVNKDITQLVEVRPEDQRFLRLLELLGEWYEKGKILIFVHSQDKCDALFKYLIGQGYPCLSLHGGKEQSDRESTISDFKSNVCNLLVATSIAARGLDVKDLELVVNFDVPNHYEDYVHRVGRTGRAGRKGCAITFISEEDAKYAPDLVKALQLSDQIVPDDLKSLADRFMVKVNKGEEQNHGTGYGGSGFKFNEAEEEASKAAKKAQAKEYGFEEDKSDSEDENDGVRKAGGDLSQQAVLAQAAALAAASKATTAASLLPISAGGLPLSLQGIAAAAVPGVDGAARAAALAAAMNLQHSLAKIQADAMPEHYEAELEINEYPQNARWRVTHKETLGPISEWTGAAITTRGQYFPPGKVCGPGDRKLYLFIEGPSEQSVKRAKADLKRALEGIMQGLPGGAGQTGKYSVL